LVAIENRLDLLRRIFEITGKLDLTKAQSCNLLKCACEILFQLFSYSVELQSDSREFSSCWA
jgi:hypothetical protein